MKNSEDEEKQEAYAKLVGSLIGSVLFGSLIFQFILWRFINKDVPWYIDIWAGVFLASNKFFVHVLAFLFIATVVSSYCGIEYPFFHLR